MRRFGRMRLNLFLLNSFTVQEVVRLPVARYSTTTSMDRPGLSSGSLSGCYSHWGARGCCKYGSSHAAFTSCFCTFGCWWVQTLFCSGLVCCLKQVGFVKISDGWSAYVYFSRPRLSLSRVTVQACNPPTRDFQLSLFHLYVSIRKHPNYWIHLWFHYTPITWPLHFDHPCCLFSFSASRWFSRSPLSPFSARCYNHCSAIFPRSDTIHSQYREIVRLFSKSSSHKTVLRQFDTSW